MTAEEAPARAAGSEERWLRVCGQKFRVLIRRATTEPARPVVFLNGIGCRADVLDDLVHGFDPSLEVIRLDPPGIGRSPVGFLPYGMPQMAWWVLRLLDQLGHEEVDVIGYSWGGVVAQQMALQADRRVRRMVLISTNTGSLSVPGKMLSMAMMFSPEAAQLLHTDDKTIGRLYGGCARRRPHDVRRTLAPDFEDPGAGLPHQLMAAMSWTTLPMAWLIHQPTLILAGTDDPMVPFINSQVLHQEITPSWLHSFDGGHLDPVLEPDWFSDEISRFLTGSVAGVPG
ncbi:alpha/beta fold hydrolase [Granulicoccus sp. GXG6511]|uniref:alpha/beta fold hydrolase n=1 Tax=Granulicoccus sp. GXG6511 TaxID=3381351 RepID=UPI003D7CDED4